MSFLEEVNKYPQATVRANNSWRRWRRSRDEVMGDQSQDKLAMAGSLLFILSAQSKQKCLRQETYT